MFVGHFAPAFALARPDREPGGGAPLWALFLAGQGLDLGFSVGVLSGFEGLAVDPGHRGALALLLGPMPWTHSLLMALLWGAVTAALARQQRVPGALALGLAVFLHWPLDLLVHRPDLPLAPGVSTLVGFGLWRSAAAAFVLEALLVLGCGLTYRARARSPARRVAAMRLTLALILVGAFTAFAPVPPPPTPGALIALMLVSIAVFSLAAASVEGRLRRRPA
jgi:hypothetical protein